MTMITTFYDLPRSYWIMGQIPKSHFFCPLLLAAKEGDVAQMSELLKQQESLNTPSIHDAFSLAAIAGHDKIIQLMIAQGVNPNPLKTFDAQRDVHTARLTAMGHAVENRHDSVIEILLKKGVTLEEVSRQKMRSESVLDLFFANHPSLGNNPYLLNLLLLKGAIIHSLKPATIFKIGVYANGEELSLLIEAGFDPKSVYIQKTNTEDKESSFYVPEINLLDLAIIQAERANIFKEDKDSIEKIELLISKGANPFSCNNRCDQNYLHQVSHFSLIQSFGNAKVNVKAKARLHRFQREEVTPIEFMHDTKTIEVLCSFGEERKNAPFLKDSEAHIKALTRVGFDSQNELNQWDKNGELFLMKAFKQCDLAAFIALIGAGINLNQQKPERSWTGLHHLFAAINKGSVSEAYDFISIGIENLEIRLINILIKHGAVPLKDTFGRTPLMCLGFNAFNTGYNNQIIQTYIEFESSYYKLEPKEYREKFFKLREGGFTTNRSLFGDVSLPIKSILSDFWTSFETQAAFNPKQSHNSIEDWNLHTLNKNAS